MSAIYCVTLGKGHGRPLPWHDRIRESRPQGEPYLLIKTTHIVDTYAEAFRLRFTRLIVTAHDDHWLEAALRAACGYGTSVIGCDAEIGIERRLTVDESPDGRPAAAVLAFGFSREGVGKAVANRAAQCLLTCPTVSLFDGLSAADDRSPLGSHIRFFGDGFEKSKILEGRRFWRVPVMDGEFLVEDTIGVNKGIGGGNFIIQASSLDAGLAAARRAVQAIQNVPGTITPFPGGVVRSGSKVGSRYDGLRASTNDAFCPSLLGRVDTGLIGNVACALEIVIDGIDEDVIARALVTGIRAAVGPDVAAISAGNYGGKLGKFHFHLRQLLSAV